ncbi:hypothetical protein [Massilia aquatica]|uniref:Uncharacterized protein n=1 Tax=Massilia aquatica TaxID=2609000 RepID=A0ABX0M3N2_9BURK|nr:hypothetical protein [Massilia aquatica]NHZ41816.1 hypothetical protein [Massilia aquatica]
MPIVSIIQALAGLYVAYASTLALNKMDKRTAPGVRYAHIALVAGSAAGVASCVVARDIFECLFAVGIALYVAGNRRGEPHDA